MTGNVPSLRFISLWHTHTHTHIHTHTRVRAHVGLFVINSRTGKFTEKLIKLKLLQGPSLAPGPFQGPGRGSSHVLTWSYVIENFAKVRYFNHNRCSFMEVCQAVNNKNIIFLDHVMFVAFVTFLVLYKYSLSYLILYFFPSRWPQNCINFRPHKNWICHCS